MTLEEVIKFLEEMKARMVPLGPLLEEKSKKDKETVDITIDAIKKQIPKKPYNSHYKQLNDEINLHSCYRCASCDHVIPYAQNYCSHCGQAIDWTEGEG